MEKKLALLTHVYNAGASVRRQIENWKSLPQAILDQIEILIVDDFSDPPLHLEIDPGMLPIRLFRILTDIPWNMAGAKNLLRRQASAPWQLYFDIDNHLPHEEFIRLFLGLDGLSPNTAYMFRRIMAGEEVDPHINSFLIHRDALNKAGGFDEDFCGHYGYEDVLFHHVLTLKGIDRVLLHDMAFIQALNAATLTLDRDLSRNNALIQQKASTHPDPSPIQVRFLWKEVTAGEP